jgi:transposase
MAKKKKRSSYTAEFKRKAVLMTFKEGALVSDVAADLGVSPQYLSQWRSDFKKSKDSKNSEEQLDAVIENAKLKSEIRQLKMDVDILKKAASYFASKK